MDLEINVKTLKKEKEELEQKSQAQKKLIQKLMEDNEKIDNKFNEVYEDNIRLRNKLNSYKDVNEILDIIENSKMDSKSRLFEEHFRNIRTRRSIDFGKEKCYEKNKLVLVNNK